MDILRKTPGGRVSDFLEAQSRIIASLSGGAGTTAAAEELVALVEEQLEAVAATVLSYDPRQHTLSAVAVGGVPEEYAEMLQDAPVGPFGTCARAAFDGRVTIHPVTEDAEDWADFRELIDRFDFRAAWSFPLFDAPGRLCGTLGLYFSEHREPSEEERALLERAAHLGGLILDQREMRASQERGETRMRQLIDRIDEGVLSLDPKGVVVLASAPARAMTIGGDPVGRALGEVFPLSDAQVAQVLASEAVEVRVDERWLRLQASSTDEEGPVIVVRDDTEERRARAQLMQADRLASIGTLAAGVAHEIASPLMALTMNLDSLADELELEDPELAACFEDARTAARRMGVIVDDLLTFTGRRRDGDSPSESVLDDVLAYTLRMIRRGLGRVRVTTDVPEGLPRVAVSPVQLGQLLTNLLINAAQATEGMGGQIWLDARRDGDELLLTIRDQGSGMTPDVAAQALEPFFTTKGDSSGTGLGLPIVHGIVHRAGGRLDLDTAPGAGTTVTIGLPLRP